MAWIGLDLGTQSVRAVLADANCTVLSRATRPLASHRAGVRHEQDPQSWLDAVDATIAEVGAGELAGIAICSTSGTFLLTDRQGRPAGDGAAGADARRVDRGAPGGVLRIP